MPDLRHQLIAFRHQPTLWVGVGSDSYGDDAAGLDLAQRLAESGIPHVVSAGTNPERWVATAQLGSFSHVVFLDAVELGAQPGSVVFLTADEIAARFPQVSTHKISLGLLARYVESQSAARAWLLGIQPQSLRLSDLHSGAPASPSPQTHIEVSSSQAGERVGVRGTTTPLLSASVQRTIQLLHQLISESDNESAEPATFDRNIALSALP
jgi:hydrogenase maturation protease